MINDCRIRGMLVAAVGLLCALVPATIIGQQRCGDTDACLRQMRDSIAKRGWLGIEYEKEGTQGLPEIIKVVEGSPAAEGGIAAGDLLVSINGVSYASPREKIYAEVKKALVPGNEVELVVERNGKEVPLTVIAGDVPEAVAAQWIGRHMLEYHLDSDSSEPERQADSADDQD